jgi:hypothetical protein
VLCNLRHLLALIGIGGKWFFYQHMLARLEC